MTAPASAPARTPVDDAGRRRVYSALTGLAALAVLLQGLWAGIFLEHDGRRDDAGGWIDVHARGGEVAILLALLATVWALARLHARKDLVLGATALTVLAVLEAYIGGLIRDDGKDALTAIHVPLAMLLMGLAVWLPFRAARERPLR
jgi:MFS family permease